MFAALTILLRSVINNPLTDLGNGMKFEAAFELAAFMPYAAFTDTWR